MSQNMAIGEVIGEVSYLNAALTAIMLFGTRLVSPTHFQDSEDVCYICRGDDEKPVVATNYCKHGTHHAHQDCLVESIKFNLINCQRLECWCKSPYFSNVGRLALDMVKMSQRSETMRLILSVTTRRFANLQDDNLARLFVRRALTWDGPREPEVAYVKTDAGRLDDGQHVDVTKISIVLTLLKVYTLYFLSSYVVSLIEAVYSFFTG